MKTEEDEKGKEQRESGPYSSHSSILHDKRETVRRIFSPYLLQILAYPCCSERNRHCLFAFTRTQALDYL